MADDFVVIGNYNKLSGLPGSGRIIGRYIDSGGVFGGSFEIVDDEITHNMLTGSSWFMIVAYPDSGYEMGFSAAQMVIPSYAENRGNWNHMVMPGGSMWGFPGWPLSAYLIKGDTDQGTQHSLRYYFQPISRSLILTQNSGGSVQVDGSTYSAAYSSIRTNYGQVRRLVPIPNVGYSATQVSINGRVVPLAAEYFVTGTSDNQTVNVVYSRITKTITASATGNGVITPSGANVVYFGDNQKFTMTPDPGHSINSLMIDGVSGEILNPGGMDYTFYNVQANHTIAANFILSPYDINVTFGSHGIVEPSGEYRAYYGETKEFVITPDPGYTVDKILVDGVRVTLPQSGRLFIV